jgi:hypothetical protein
MTTNYLCPCGHQCDPRKSGYTYYGGRVVSCERCADTPKQKNLIDDLTQLLIECGVEPYFRCDFCKQRIGVEKIFWRKMREERNWALEEVREQIKLHKATYSGWVKNVVKEEYVDNIIDQLRAREVRS